MWYESMHSSLEKLRDGWIVLPYHLQIEANPKVEGKILKKL